MALEFSDMVPTEEEVPGLMKYIYTEVWTEREADLVELYLIKRKRVSDLATIYGVPKSKIQRELQSAFRKLEDFLADPESHAKLKVFEEHRGK